MNLTRLVLVLIGLALVIFGAVALVGSSWVAGVILVIVGLVVLGAANGGITI